MGVIKSILGTLFIYWIFFIKMLVAISQKSFRVFEKNVLRYGYGVTKQFDEAIQKGNIEWLDEILTKCPKFDVNYCGTFAREYGQSGSYVHETIMQVTADGHGGNMKVLKYLMDKGLDINIGIRTKGGKNILYLASEGGNTRLFDFLIENNIKINTWSDALLHRAIRDSLKKTKTLLEKGVRLTAKTFDGVGYELGKDPSALQYALKYYRAHGGNMNILPMSRKETFAILGEDELLIRELRNNPKFEPYEPTAVRNFISCYCKLETLKVFEEVRKEQAYFSSDLISKLFRLKRHEIIRYAVDNKLIGTRGNGTQVIALYLGVNDLEMCDRLIEQEIYSDDSTGWEMLSAAFESENIDTFIYAAQKVSELFGLNEYTFFDVRGHIKWSDFTKAAFDHLRERYGLTMLCIPLNIVDVKTAEYLYDNGKELFPTDLSKAVNKNDPEMVKLVLEKGADPNQDMYQAFDFCVSGVGYKYDTTYRDFLDAHEGENAKKSRSHVSCISFAVTECDTEIIQLLIDYGANMNDDELLWEAICFSSKAAFNVLFNGGASTGYRNDMDRETLIDTARKMGRKDIIKMLRKKKVRSYSPFRFISLKIQQMYDRLVW